MPEKSRIPEWSAEISENAMATRVVQGVNGGHDGLPDNRKTSPQSVKVRRRRLAPEDYVAGVLGRDRTILARTITLIESNAAAHIVCAQNVIKQLLPRTGHSIRVGITGVPGVGKSTFIEALGCYLCRKGHRVAVLAVDPSSSVTGGSILGDKTRMERLSREEQCFIRPSPSGGTLGGVSRKSRETILVCEAAGFDVILLETVGVGQNEVTVRSMVDFMLLLMITGAGDELQGIKKGVIELADALVINKADGDNITRAEAARSEYAQALHYLTPLTEGWTTKAYTCSSLTEAGISQIWDVIQTFSNLMKKSGLFDFRRREQNRDWLHAMIEEELWRRFYHHPDVAMQLPSIEQTVLNGGIPVAAAAQKLFAIFDSTESKEQSAVK